MPNGMNVNVVVVVVVRTQNLLKEATLILLCCWMKPFVQWFEHEGLDRLKHFSLGQNLRPVVSIVLSRDYFDEVDYLSLVDELAHPVVPDFVVSSTLRVAMSEDGVKRRLVILVNGNSALREA